MSRYSTGTQQIFKQTEKQSQNKLQKIQERALSQDNKNKEKGMKMDCENISKALGLYIYRHLVQNVAVQVNKWGTFNIL